ncbi:PhzF family phenazine biosynthesis protein [Xenorhabdus bovienii]|uniref:PhzF family phenazine biosynthesis protein n=1 Tax=Xenorhabdus bovienii TaxID=40576 RepID=UPI00237CC918|nr:PhzF family phenazine biosynthesis protein [Xenorhabdus bovienii]MDE1488542.1 PhzF family phenazine biosynthesis protein [Xenorhabdus bovienii]MDE9479414.1 PhzF family phenazine biosynthesis protein [Xenorhabdus bovienii]MDE9532251.1 PhzF family phenazine biosynthesis protein [Xenorhabdus bovienii]
MYKYTIVNSFGSDLFTGNPVAVFFNCDDLDDYHMQKLAAEINLSETTFIRAPIKGGDFNVKIFTPVNELGFAGHPLLGTALALAQETGLSEMNIETQKGVYRFSVDLVKEQPYTVYVQMEQPKPAISPYEYRKKLLEALGVEKSTLPIDIYDVGPRHVFVGVENVDILAKISPDLKKLSRFNNIATLCFCPNGTGSWRLRMFSPAYGVAEDAATGSAAGPLALHLCRYGLSEFGKMIEIIQGVEMERPSYMNAVAKKTNEEFLLEAGGYAFQVAVGQYFI